MKCIPCKKMVDYPKQFKDKYGGAHSINFVDENNCFIGFDVDQDCCEHVGWFISEKWYFDLRQRDTCDVNDETNIDDVNKKINGYRFDKDWIKFDNQCVYDEGGMYIFKMINIKREILYLHLFNSHNGYYGHALSMFDNEFKLIQKVL